MKKISLPPVNNSSYYLIFATTAFTLGALLIVSLFSTTVLTLWPYAFLELFVMGLYLFIAIGFSKLSLNISKKIGDYGFESLLLITLLVLISYCSRYVIFTFLGLFSIFFIIVGLAKIANLSRSIASNILIFSLVCFFGAFSIVHYLWFQTALPLYLERIILTGLHLDTLFHAALSNISNNYGEISLGISGLSSFKGYYFAEYLYGRLAILGDVEVLAFYNYGTPLIILPLFFLVFCSSIMKFHLGSHLKYRPREALVVLVASVAFFLLIYSPFPIVFFRSIGLWDGVSISSESQLLGLMFLTLAIQNMWTLHQKLSNGDHKIVLHIMTVFFLMVLMAITKQPAMLHFIIFSSTYFFIVFLFDKKEYSFLIYSLVSLLFVFIVFKLIGELGITVGFPFSERFLYFQHEYVLGRWPLLLLALSFIPCLIHHFLLSKSNVSLSNDATLFHASRVGLIVSLFFVALFPFVGLIWRIGLHYGSIQYFFNYAIFIPAVILTYILLDRGSKEDFVFFKEIKGIPLPILLILLTFVIIKISDVILIVKESVWAQDKTINQVMAMNSAAVNEQAICQERHPGVSAVLDKSFESLRHIRCVRKFYKNYLSLLKEILKGSLIQSLPTDSPYWYMSKFINQLLVLSKNSLNTDRSKTALYVARDYRLKLSLNDGQLWSPRQLCDPFPYLIPAVSGYGALFGLTEDSCTYFGQYGLDKKGVQVLNQRDFSEKELCAEARRYNLDRVLILQNPKDITEVSCK